jgi:hypothetical protein
LIINLFLILKKIFGIAEGLLNFANMNSSSLVKNRALLNRIVLQSMENSARLFQIDMCEQAVRKPGHLETELVRLI